MLRAPFLVASLIALSSTPTTLAAQEETGSSAEKTAAEFDPEAAIRRGVEILVELQEGEGTREWPYEGVYRTNENGRRRVIPIGYRVGGTSISSLALLEAPGWKKDKDRQKAIARGLDFVLEALDEPLMAPTIVDSYDVRGWGQIYALQFLLRLRDLDRVPKGKSRAVTDWIERLVDILEETAIPEKGGWNYAGRRAPSPFMTAPGLLALFHARARGHKIDETVLTEALDALERGRASAGSIAYSVPGRSREDTDEEDLRFMDKLPGSIGRMVSVESVLTLAGRGDPKRLSTAVASFFEHWEQLEVRRQKNGTHIRPFGVAPYYFIYGHHYAALAIELLADDEERTKQRAALHAKLAETQEEDGGWNDRVFPRSRNYGTAVGILALRMKDTPRPIGYEPQATKRSGKKR